MDKNQAVDPPEGSDVRAGRQQRKKCARRRVWPIGSVGRLLDEMSGKRPPAMMIRWIQGACKSGAGFGLRRRKEAGVPLRSME